MGDSESKSEKPAAPQDPAKDRKSGRVGFDARGNAVWEWQMKTGVFGRDIDTRHMKKLEARDLKIAEDPMETSIRKTKIDAKRKQTGFDPYNSDGKKPGKDPFRRK